jgi:hypothetical protein
MEDFFGCDDFGGFVGVFEGVAVLDLPGTRLALEGERPAES